MWTLRGLIDHANSTQAQINGKWVPARPLSGYGLYGLRLRIRAVPGRSNRRHLPMSGERPGKARRSEHD